MPDANDPLAWVARAEEDYALARSALRRRVPLTYGSTFHAQQCVEKYLKAFLMARGQPFPALSDLWQRHGIMISGDLQSLERLAAYAVQVRYPGEDPSVEEAQEAWQVARAVRRSARSLLGLR